MTKSTKPVNRYWGAKDLPKSKARFFNAVTVPTSAGEGTVATIRLYGPIDSWGGFWGVSAKDFGAVLDALPDSVTQIILRINSPGGEVFEGVTILNMLRAHKANVIGVVDGLAASAASVVAAGCDDTVMSPGTQMMIHSPWGIEIGNAREMRKHADLLDSLETSLIDIYAAKAGDKDWAQLLADDTWLTPAAAVELGLADRIAVIPDAGETDTVGDTDDEELITVPLEDDDEDLDFAARIRMFHSPASAVAALAQRPPSSPEPGTTTEKEKVVTYDNLKAGFRERLGVSDAAVSDEQLMSALDEALAEQATTATVPEGTVLIDSGVLADLQANAEAGRTARNDLDTSRREATVDAALAEGRITAASRDTWLASLARDEEGATALLGTLAKNTVPVVEIGLSETTDTADDRAYNAIYGEKTEA